MALRIAGYDGADYHAQYVNYTSTTSDTNTEANGTNKVKANPSLVPVYTYVLYFGLTHWNAPTSLSKALSPASLSNDEPEGFNDLDYPVIEVAFANPDQIKAMRSDFRYIASIMVELRKLYEQKGVKVEDLDLSDLLHVLRNQPKLTYRIDVERLLEALCEDPRRSTKEDTPAHKTASLFIYQVFDRVCNDPTLGDDNVVTELFPNLQKRVGGKVFWQAAARWVLAGTDEKVVLNVMDPDGSLRAMYPRPDNFPDCFATTQPKPATVPIGGGGPKPIVAMSPDAQ